MSAPNPDRETSGDDDLLISRAVRSACGGVSDMTIWRWQRDPDVRFPLPDLTIHRRRYWKKSTITAWKKSREAA